MQVVWDQLDQSTTDYSWIASDRGIFPETVMQWGCVYSPLLQRWLAPGYNVEGQVRQLYKYDPGSKIKMRGVKGLGHQLYGVNLYEKHKKELYVCEGFWDGARLWEALKAHRLDDEDKAGPTVSMTDNLLADANVLAVPGANTFKPEWCSLFADKDVYLLYDNDQPRVHEKTGETIKPTALQGVQRVASILAAAKKQPEEVSYLQY
jgi:hypothetical protein